MTTYKVTQGFTSTKPYVVVGSVGRWTWQGAPSTINSSAMGGTTVQHGVPITLSSPGSGTKSDHTLPLFDYGADAAYGATSGQWNATGSKSPTAAPIASYNIQNQPPGWSPTGAFIHPANPFVKAVISGAHYPNGGNDANGVYLGYAWTPPNNGTIVTGYPFCSVHEFDYCYDPLLNYNPQSDNNTKQHEGGDSSAVFPGSGQYFYVEPFPIGLFPISAISNANPMVIHCPQNQAVSPIGVGDNVCFFGIPGIPQLNGTAAVCTTQAGSNGNFILTFAGVDSTAFGVYPGTFTISAATNASPCVITINTVSTSHPLASRTFLWAQGAAGGTWAAAPGGVPNFNQKNNLCAINLGGVSGAWTAELIDGQFGGVNIDSTGFGTYTPNSATFTVGGQSVPFSVQGATTAQNTYITPKSFRINPLSQFQNPDAAGHSMTSIAQLIMACSTAGVPIRRRIEMCWSQTQALTPGYFRVFDNNTLVFSFVGQTDNLSASTILRHFGMGSMYQSSRGINNYVHFQNPYYDWTPAGGQVFRVYAGNASSFAACTKLVPQPFLGAITNTSVPLTSFWQGALLDTDTVWFYAMPEASAVGTSVALQGGAAFTITPVPKPTITTATLPTAFISVAYNSGAIAVSGGTAPYTYYLSGSATGGGYNAKPSLNTWAVNSSTGAITGTPVNAEIDLVTITVIDANGYNTALQYQLTTTFSFFLSPTGDDSNAGTLASPWSITAINSKQSTYAGKGVGLLPGTYTQGTVSGTSTTLYAIHSAMTTSSCALQIQGGTAGFPTFIGACDSSGLYSPKPGLARTAILDFSLPGVGTRSTTDGHCIGQSSIGASHVPTVAGNITIGGIMVTLGTTSLIGFQGGIGGSFAWSGLLIQDCELYDALAASSNNNPGMLFFYKQMVAGLIKNCKIHHGRTAGGTFTPYGQSGIMFNQDVGTAQGFTALVDHCTIYDAGPAIEPKNNYSNVSAQYSHLEFASLAVYTGTAFQFAVTGGTQAPGSTATFKFCVIIGGIDVQPTDGTANQGTVHAFNCTFYCGAGATVGNDMFTFIAQGATGQGSFDHNIVWSDGSYDPGNNGIGSMGFNALGGGFTAGNNYYGTGCTFGATISHRGALSVWQAQGFDLTSSTITITPFLQPPVTGTVSSFITRNTVLKAQDGLICGALGQDGKAADGSGLVGCDW